MYGSFSRAVRFTVFSLILGGTARFLTESAAAASIGLINSVGNLGGFVGPMVMGYLASRTHSFTAGLLYLVASLFVSGALMLAVGSAQASIPDAKHSVDLTARAPTSFKRGAKTRIVFNVLLMRISCETQINKADGLIASLQVIGIEF